MIDCIFKNNGCKINNLNSNLATLGLILWTEREFIGFINCKSIEQRADVNRFFANIEVFSRVTFN